MTWRSAPASKMARHALVAGHKKFGRYACALTQPPPRTADCAPMLAVCVAALALTTPPTGLWSRRGSLAAGVAAATLPRPSSAFNIITYVTQLEKDTTKKTAVRSQQPAPAPLTRLSALSVCPRVLPRTTRSGRFYSGHRDAPDQWTIRCEERSGPNRCWQCRRL